MKKDVSGRLCMPKKYRWLLWAIALLLIGNFVVLRVYGDTLRSTHLFIVRGTVFYPVALLNLVAGTILVALLVRDIFTRRRRTPPGS